jgi:maleylacetate reductase
VYISSPPLIASPPWAEPIDYNHGNEWPGPASEPTGSTTPPTAARTQPRGDHHMTATGLAFTYQALPMRVVLAAGAITSLPAEIDRLGLRRALVLCGPGRPDIGRRIAEALGDRAAGVLAEARMHVPIEVANRARDRARELGADSCVTVGGGSAIGLGKAIALEHGIPVVAVPTTYAGSEMTPVWGLTQDGQKRTGRDPRVLPKSVIYDPELTLTLPVDLSVTSGTNALAHAVEALYAPDASPVISLMAEEGARALTEALPTLVRSSHDLDARSRAQYGAWLCGACLGATTMSLHHKLCHALGGTLDLPHAPTHTVVLPHALAYNQPAAPQAVAALSRALGGTADPARTLWERSGELGAPRSLRELGMAEADVTRIVGQVLASPYANPVEVTEDGLTRLLRAAWAGDPPAG